MKEADCYFPSEKDWWLGLLVWSPLLLVPYEAITGGPWQTTAIGLGIYSLLAGWIWFGTNYRITANQLHVKSGPFRFSVPLASIRRIRRTSSPLSAPALSMQRLEIALENGQLVLISPKDRERFIAMLRSRCPQARFEV